MRIVFMGTPEFAVPSLERAAASFDVALVITRPDAVRGRGKTLEPSPVKACALDLGIDVLETTRMTPEAKTRIAGTCPDIIAVAAYGCIIPDDVIAMARLECINVHASLLPRWRGAAPIQRAILAGDGRVGVSIMRIAHDLDAGAYCRQASTETGVRSASELFSELGAIGADALVASIRDIEAGTAVWTEQDESKVTRAPKVTKAEMRLDPADPAAANALRVQASTDAAPARASVCGKGLRVMRAAVANEPCPEPSAIAIEQGRVFLGCSQGALELLLVKPDGKREMDAASWSTGLRDGTPSWGRA